MDIFKKYIKELQKIPIEELTEHSKRSALELLLNEIASELNEKIIILHEPRRIESYGSPDFKIFTDASIIGYVENKKIDENLDKILKTSQIKKYLQLSDNILLTNYVEFIWLKKGQINGRETLCYLSDIQNKRFKINKEKENAVFQLITNFFSQAPLGLASIEDLAVELAKRSKYLKDFLQNELINQETKHTEEKLFGLFQTFQKNIFNELTINEFADAFAQMLVYGLFLAKLNADTKEINLQNAKKFIPQSMELIRELVNFIDILEEREEYKEILWIVEEVISLVNNLQLDAIKQNLSFAKKNKSELPETDPYIYFYENFLAAYDSKLRKSKGVYYTPPAVVNFIIRAIDSILANKLKIENGLSNRKKVTVLDFATGTGTFIVEIIKQIFENTPKSKKNKIISEHILKNIFGFEYLIAPYTIAHLKLSQFLTENGYNFQKDERLNIFLTNTLEPIETQSSFLLPAMAKEGKQAQKIKEKPVLVITGNPPYSVKSKNKGKWIINKLSDYKPKDEINIQPLSDDYIKFIRFAHDKMKNLDKGVIGIITNNSFLSGVTHRKMRNSLLNDFSEIYILNLHGHYLENENVTGIRNVFDITVGVSISFFIKDKLKNQDCKLFYKDLYGTREDKYKYLQNTEFADCGFEEVNYLEFNSKFNETKWGNRFIDDLSYFQNTTLNGKLNKYGNFWGLSEIFQIFGSGVSTARDKITIHFSKKSLKTVLTDFENLTEKEISEKYNTKDSRDWKIQRAKDDIKKNINKDKFCKIQYRPFDIRETFYTGKTNGFIVGPRKKLDHHFVNKENIGLIFPRYSMSEFTHGFITKYITDYSAGGSRSAAETNIAPLYIYTNGNLLPDNNKKITKTENFTIEFRKYINEKYNEQITPEQILSYIYAILHSPSYRKNYSEFLNMDFPRIFFTNDINLFLKLSKIGWELIQSHLLNTLPKNAQIKHTGNYTGEGTDQVLQINLKFIDNKANTGKLYINKTQYFNNISQNIYDYKVGGYQVIEKYLRARKDKILNLDEIETVEKIIKALYNTISKMKLIEKLTKSLI